MAKRFIDTNLFNDEWFCDLSKDCKLFFIYYITTCDHAGVLRLNKKLCEFQTGLKSIDTLIKELGNSLVTVKEGLFFMPKFIEFQYPNFPQSTVKQQDGAMKILKSLGFWDETTDSYLRVNKELPNSYVYDNVIVNNNKGVVFNFKSELIKNGFDEKLVTDWLLVRKSKKATNTETALNRFLKEVEKSGKDKNDVLRICVEKSWSGLDSEWITNLTPNTKPPLEIKKPKYTHEELFPFANPK